jgi:hypothetical protein
VYIEKTPSVMRFVPSRVKVGGARRKSRFASVTCRLPFLQRLIRTGSGNMSKGPIGTIALAELWILTAALLSAAGWILTPFKALNFPGYAGVVGIWLCLVGWWWTHRGGRKALRIMPFCRLRRRSRLRLFRLIYVAIWIGSLLGGILYLPANYDTLTYRLPQSFHWLAEGQWHWLETFDNRINFAPPGQTWIFNPLILFTGSLRLLFLPNLVCFTLLPGLLFVFLRQIGVSRKVAAYWMYVFPTAYGLSLPAGGIGNDLLGAVFFLSAMCFALRSRAAQAFYPCALSLVACALSTAVKTVNLPLLAPLAVALWPSRQLFLANIGKTAATIVVAVLVSFLPTAVLNHLYTGDWSGDPQNEHKMKMRSPIHALVGNIAIVGVSNLQPPINPFSGAINAALRTATEGPSVSRLKEHFPRFQLGVAEIPTEEGAALGLTVTILLLIALLSPLMFRGLPPIKLSRLSLLTGLAAVVSLLSVMCMVGSEGTGRHLMSCYAPLLPLFLWHRANETLLGKRWWRRTAAFCGACTLVPLVLSPSRPLFPAKAVFSALSERWPHSALLTRSHSVYSVYENRAVVLDPLKRHLPEGEPIIGFVSSDQPEISLWFPFGSRRLFHLTPKTLERLQSDEISTLVISARGLADKLGMSLPQFLKRVNGRLVATEQIATKVTWGLEPWYVVRTEGRPYHEHVGSPRAGAGLPD